MAGYMLPVRVGENVDHRLCVGFHIDNPQCADRIRETMHCQGSRRVALLQLDGDELDAALWGIANYVKGATLKVLHDPFCMCPPCAATKAKRWPPAAVSSEHIIDVFFVGLEGTWNCTCGEGGTHFDEFQAHGRKVWKPKPLLGPDPELQRLLDEEDHIEHTLRGVQHQDDCAVCIQADMMAYQG